MLPTNDSDVRDSKQWLLTWFSTSQHAVTLTKLGSYPIERRLGYLLQCGLRISCAPLWLQARVQARSKLWAAVADTRLKNDDMVLSAEERPIADNLSSVVDRDWINGRYPRSRQHL